MAGLPVCVQHNIRATARDNTGQNTNNGHTPSPRIEIKISDPIGNRTRVTELESRDYTDHASATDKDLDGLFALQKLIVIQVYYHIIKLNIKKIHEFIPSYYAYSDTNERIIAETD